MGEFGLIGAIERVVRATKPASSNAWEGLVIGIGDDTAVWRTREGLELATTDALVQDVHFTLGTITWNELGWKALAINMSDIAAMGGAPTYALVALALPGDLEADHVMDFYQGMAEIAGKYGVAIAGGNIAQSPEVVITVTVLGVVNDPGRRILTRSAAVPGDQIAVTGYPGLSSAGLRMLGGRLDLGQATAELLRRAHNQPEPRVSEGQSIVAAGAHACIDISDGLVGDLSHICEGSRVSARLDLGRLPVHHLLKRAFPRGYQDLILYGGEDYELLFTASPPVVASIKRAVPIRITVIGEIIDKGEEPVTMLAENGKTVLPSRASWEHFRTPPR